MYNMKFIGNTKSLAIDVDNAFPHTVYLICYYNTRNITESHNFKEKNINRYYRVFKCVNHIADLRKSLRIFGESHGQSEQRHLESAADACLWIRKVL